MPSTDRVPTLPPGRQLDLPGRGTTFVRELAGPPNAPTVILLHGWTVTADLNWFTSYEALSEHFRVVAIDHRGHGRGIRPNGRFSLEDCADDVAVLADVLEVDQFIAVGYSMGGSIAQLLWQRHPLRVSGLVLSATARTFSTNRSEALSFLGMGGLAALTQVAPGQTREWMSQQFIARKGRLYEEWALDEVRLNDITAMLQAGYCLGQFSSHDWIHGLDVPAAVVVTTQDRTVPTRRQLRLAESIPDASVFRVPAGHDACFSAAPRYVPALINACNDVTRRSMLASNKAAS